MYYSIAQHVLVCIAWHAKVATITHGVPQLCLNTAGRPWIALWGLTTCAYYVKLGTNSSSFLHSLVRQPWPAQSLTQVLARTFEFFTFTAPAPVRHAVLVPCHETPAMSDAERRGGGFDSSCCAYCNSPTQRICIARRRNLAMIRLRVGVPLLFCGRIVVVFGFGIVCSALLAAVVTCTCLHCLLDYSPRWFLGVAGLVPSSPCNTERCHDVDTQGRCISCNAGSDGAPCWRQARQPQNRRYRRGRRLGACVADAVLTLTS